MVRIVQRFGARTVDDLMVAVRLIWSVIWQAARKGEDDLDALFEPPPQGHRISLEGVGTLVIGRHWTRRAIVLKTVLAPDATEDVEAA
jgi:hypothetical protein